MRSSAGLQNSAVLKKCSGRVLSHVATKTDSSNWDFKMARAGIKLCKTCAKAKSSFQVLKCERWLPGQSLIASSVANRIVLDMAKRFFVENSLRFNSGRTKFHF